MFYAQAILSKKGAMHSVWLSAHLSKRLDKNMIFQTDVTKSAQIIAKGGAGTKQDMPLRVSGSLLLGVVRIYSHKVRFLSTDCDEALQKMKTTFRPGAITAEGGGGGGGEGGNNPPSQQDNHNNSSSQQGGGGRTRDKEIDGTPNAATGEQQQDVMTLRWPSTAESGRGRGTFQRLTLEDVLPPLGDEWLDAASQTMARKQDITMEESDNIVSRSSMGGTKGLLLHGRLSQEHHHSHQHQQGSQTEGEGEGGRTQMSTSSYGGGGNNSQESGGAAAMAIRMEQEGDDWEVFDPAKLGLEERVEREEDEEMDGDPNYDDDGFGADDHDVFQGDDEEDYRNPPAGREEEEEEDPELARFGSATRGSTANEEDGSPVLLLSGRKDGRDTLSLGADERLVGAGGVVLGEDGIPLPSPPRGTPEYRLAGLSASASASAAATAAVGMATVDEEEGDEEELQMLCDSLDDDDDDDAYDMDRQGRIRFSDSVTLVSRRRSQAGKKRPLPLDRTLIITSKEMKEQMMDYDDLMLARVRPRDRVRGGGGGGVKTMSMSVGKGKSKKSAAGAGVGDDLSMDMVEARLQTHVFNGELTGEMEEVFGRMMKPVHRFDLPVAKRRLVLVQQQQQQQAAMLGKKRAREEEEEEEERERDEDEPGAVLQSGEDGRYNMFDDDFRMDDNEDDYYHYQGEMQGEGEGAEEKINHGNGYDDDDGSNDFQGGGEGEREDDEEADPDGFIRQNAFAGDEAPGEATTQWHPNTVRMCKLLRTRIATAAKEKPHERPPTVPFSQVTRNARRTKAANLFWEVLQLKTWDFIEVYQEHAYDDVQITAAARFHEAIPGDVEEENAVA